jgi:hypothetical protein
MATNNKIIKKNERICKLWYGSLHRQYHKDLSILSNEVRADTAKQIFAEIESIKDEYGNPLLDTTYGKDEQYAKLKTKYKVD